MCRLTNVMVVTIHSCNEILCAWHQQAKLMAAKLQKSNGASSKTVTLYSDEKWTSWVESFQGYPGCRCSSTENSYLWRWTACPLIYSGCLLCPIFSWIQRGACWVLSWSLVAQQRTRHSSGEIPMPPLFVYHLWSYVIYISRNATRCLSSLLFADIYPKCLLCARWSTYI